MSPEPSPADPAARAPDRDPRGSRVGSGAWPRLALCALSLGWAPGLAAAGWSQIEPAPADDEALQQQPAEDPLAPAREALRRGGSDPAVLSVWAMELLQAGDLVGLRRVLEEGPRESVLGVLHALEVRRVDGLLDVLVGLAADDDAEVAQGAARHVRVRARESADVVAALIQRLATPGLPQAVRRTLVVLLGQSRDLAAVESLIAELDGPVAREADAGLVELTGQRPPARAEPAAWWRGLWDAHRTDRRDELLELALQVERDRVRAMTEEVIQTRLLRMGQEVDQLVDALDDEYKRVRLAALERLVAHANRQQAASAVPLILRRLDHAAGTAENGNGAGAANGTAAGNGNGGANGDGDGVANGDGGAAGGGGANGNGGAADPVERDLEVRAALVEALGALGGDRADVQAVLLDVLRSDDLLSARAAVAALERLRDEPSVVAPLLQFLGRSSVDDETLVTVLEIVARNQPVDVFAELSHWLGASYDRRVRAAALEAVLADAELSRALPAVVDMADAGQPLDVRYALARSLGSRASGLAADDPARAPMLSLLSRLVGDADPSVRAEAAASLGSTGDVEALPVLEQRSRAETDAGVVERLIEAFGSLGRPEATETIGRLWSAWASDSRAAGIEEASRRALAALTPADDPAAQLAMAVRLRESGAARLAAWAAQQVVLGFEASPGQDVRELVARARGEWAEALSLDGRHQEARDLLQELHDAQAPYPPPTRRLELLALNAAALGLHGQAADESLALLALLPGGDSQRPVVRRRAVTALQAAGRLGEALAQLGELIVELGPAADLLLLQARLQLDDGQPDAARASLDALLAQLGEQDDSALASEARALRASIPEAAAPAAEADAGPPSGDEPDADDATGPPVDVPLDEDDGP